MNGDCPDCEMWRRNGANFCQTCGKRLGPSTDNSMDIWQHMRMLALTLVSIIIIVNTIYSLIHFGDISNALDAYRFDMEIRLGLWDVHLFYYYGTGATIILAICLIVEMACLIYAIYRFKTRWDEKGGYSEKTEDSGLSRASSALCVGLLVSLVSGILLGMLGANIDSSWMDELDRYVLSFLLTQAGLHEELLCRALYIGVPMMVIAFILHREKNCWQYIFGGFGMSKVAVAIIFISALIFGVAHSEGWGWAKVPGALFSGILFGYIYAEYGLYACIIMHTANDTFMSIADIGFPFLAVVSEFALVGMGVFILYDWITKPNRELMDFKNMRTFPDRLECNLLEQWGRH